jgi:DNA polymerase-3 subunit delta'
VPEDAALGTPSQPSHAYLFHGPGGAGNRAAARALAAELLAEGEADPESARARVMSGAHPDLTWVVPSGAHEILVSDIDEPVISAASRTPFESSRRVFVIERADELGDEAANRMLKTLEEPAAFVHLILLTDRLGEILPTIRSRCQTVTPAPQRPKDHRRWPTKLAVTVVTTSTPWATITGNPAISTRTGSRARLTANAPA